jgi:Acetyltransferase (GNAT) domain
MCPDGRQLLGYIRPLRESDVAAAAQLHQEIFEIAPRNGLADRYRDYFVSTFLCSGRQFDSLVYEEQDGRITGFLGVVARDFTMAGRPLRAALSTQLVVDLEARRKLVGVAMLREFLKGPQDFSFTDEANEPSRKIWEMLGGSTVRLYSTHWSAPIRPAQFFLSRKQSRIASTAAGIADALIVRARRVHLKKHTTSLDAQPLDAKSVADLITSQRQFVLKPSYGPDSLQGYINDRTRGVVLFHSSGAIAGWYIYDLDHRGIGEVLQVGCGNQSAVNVLAHLFQHALHERAVILYGRLEPQFSDALPEHVSVLSRRQYRMLVHSRDAEIVAAFHSGKAFVSRLEGEWPVRFQPG